MGCRESVISETGLERWQGSGEGREIRGVDGVVMTLGVMSMISCCQEDSSPTLYVVKETKEKI